MPFSQITSMDSKHSALQARVHACLDGEIPPEALSLEERAELTRQRMGLALLKSRLGAVPAPDLTDAVMRRIHEESRRKPVLMRVLAWLWTPRLVRFMVRPAYAAAFALVLLLALPMAKTRFAGSAVAASPPVYVQFQLHAAGAYRVELAGTFTSWEPSVPLQEVQPGVWTAVVAVQPGIHDYTFLVDERDWTVDPYAPQVDDSFGGRNNRLPVPDPSART